MWELDQVRRVRRVGPRSLDITIPPIIRYVLNVSPGDHVAFQYEGEGENRKVILTKIAYDNRKINELNLYRRVLDRLTET